MTDDELRDMGFVAGPFNDMLIEIKGTMLIRFFDGSWELRKGGKGTWYESDWMTTTEQVAAQLESMRT